MNGVNEVQSSSMVQRRIDPVVNEVMSSTMLQSSLEDHQSIATIMEDENEERFQAIPSSPFVPQTISNRVLTEISVTATNTPMSINITEKPNENPSRESGTQHNQVNSLLFHTNVV